MIERGNEMLKFNEVGYPNDQEKQEFVDYLLMFYGKNDPEAIYGEEVGMEKADAVKFMNVYLEGDFKGYDGYHMWGGGDTIDREKVCELFLNAKEVA